MKMQVVTAGVLLTVERLYAREAYFSSFLSSFLAVFLPKRALRGIATILRLPGVWPTFKGVPIL